MYPRCSPCNQHNNKSDSSRRQWLLHVPDGEREVASEEPRWRVACEVYGNHVGPQPMPARVSESTLSFLVDEGRLDADFDRDVTTRWCRDR